MKKLPKTKLHLKTPLNKWSKKKIIITSVLAVAVIGAGAVLLSFNAKKNDMRDKMTASFTTETAKVERQTLANSISATGTIESAETKTVNTKMSNMEVYTIQYNEHFIVSATVDEYDIASIEKGMTAYVKTDATGDVEMTGEVTYVAIAPSSTGGSMGAISSSASYRIEITIHDPAENLRAGMTAKLSIALEESADALTVPYDAVTTTPDGKSTITAEVDGEKKTITVETGLETDYYTEIISDEIYEV